MEKTKKFIESSKKIHLDKYDYSLTIYINNKSKVKIICKNHGEFIQRASNHLLGRGCAKCQKSKKYDTSKFINLSSNIHNNKYLYHKTLYDGSHNPVIITCPNHGDFTQLATNHLSGKGCSKCNTENTRLDDAFDKMNKVHNNKYIYSNDFINLRSKISISCKDHGDFKQRAKNHLLGQGCPICGSKFGVKENKWLDSLNIVNRQVRIKNYIVDGFDPNTNTIYEFNGDFWHGNPDIFEYNEYNKVLKKTFGELYQKTLKKREELEKIGYTVISIWENDFNKLFIF